MNIDKTFYATPNFPSSDCSYDEQILAAFFTPCRTHFIVPPCTDTSTSKHVKESDVKMTFNQNFVINISLLSIRIVKCKSVQAFITV